MELNKVNISANNAVANEHSQLLLSCELIADSKPAIDKVLKADGRILIESREVMDDRVSYRGKFSAEVLYLSKGDRRVYSINAEAPVNDFTEIKGIQKGMRANVSADISNIDYNMINDRKVNISALADVGVKVSQSAELDAISYIDDIPVSCQRYTNIVSDVVVAGKKDSFNINEEVTLPPTKLPIEQILTVEANIINPDFTPKEDSVNVSGDVAVTMLYTAEDNSMPEVYEFELPFDGNIEAEGAREGMSVNGTLDIENIYYNVESNDAGENRIVDTEIKIVTEFQVTQTREEQILEDAYSTGNSIDMTTEKICCDFVVCRNKSQYPVKSVISLSEEAPDMLQIFKTGGKPYIDEVKIEDNKVIIDGVVNADIMYVTGNDEVPVYNYSGVIPFSQTVEARGAKEGMHADVEANIAHMGFNMLSDREVEVRCAINTNTVVTDKVCYDVPTSADMKPLDEEALNKLPSTVIYVVKPGDTLWKLAKRFNSTVEDIADINNIENPDLIYPGERFVIFKKHIS